MIKAASNGQNPLFGLPVAKIETPDSAFQAFDLFAFASPADGINQPPAIH
jgi:hypothetical protein